MGRRLLIAVTGFGLVTIGFGLSQSFALSLMLLFCLGACDNISVVIRGVLVQLLTPDEMRGRVSAIDGVFIGTSNELGAFESGVVAELLGPVPEIGDIDIAPPDPQLPHQHGDLLALCTALKIGQKLLPQLLVFDQLPAQDAALLPVDFR